MFRKFRRRIHILRCSGSPLAVSFRFLPDLVRAQVHELLFSRRKKNFLRQMASGTFSSHWFLDHFSKWTWLIRRFRLRRRVQSVLEIGSWEGLSAFFFLAHLPRASLVAVDTWTGSDEHSTVKSDIFQVCQQNLRPFEQRTCLLRMASEEFFYDSSSGYGPFDLAYVDGSHRAKDVYNDAKGAFANLKPGGFLVLDDYFWDYYDDCAMSPASGANLFLREEKGHYTVIDTAYQLTLRKRHRT